MDSASNEIASNEFPDLKSWFSSPSVVISLLFMIGSKEILVLKSQIFGPLELVRSEISVLAIMRFYGWKQAYTVALLNNI